jgi:hypothetical protein
MAEHSGDDSGNITTKLNATARAILQTMCEKLEVHILDCVTENRPDFIIPPANPYTKEF